MENMYMGTAHCGYGNGTLCIWELHIMYMNKRVDEDVGYEHYVYGNGTLCIWERHIVCWERDMMYMGTVHYMYE